MKISLETCKYCGSPVRSDRLERHIMRLHSTFSIEVQTKEVNIIDLIGSFKAPTPKYTRTERPKVIELSEQVKLRRLFDYLSEESRHKISILALLNGHILDRAFLRISTFSPSEWLEIQCILLDNFEISITEYEMFKNYKFLTFPKILCSYIKTSSTKEHIDVCIKNYIEYYLELSYIVKRNMSNSIIDKICCYETSNFICTLNLLIKNGDFLKANELANNLEGYWHLSKKLFSIVRSIHPNGESLTTNISYNNSTTNEILGRTGVFYDDECFWVIFNDKVITTTLSAREGLDYLNKYISEINL